MLYNCAWLFKILDKVIHSKSLSTEQLHIQWTASQWTKWGVQKKTQWLASYLLKHYWSVFPRVGYHMRCSQTCTNKRNLKYPLKRIMGYNIKVPIASKPAKLRRTYER